MTDGEKVIKGLHETRRYLEDKEWADGSASSHISHVIDTIELLKEQQRNIEYLSAKYYEMVKQYMTVRDERDELLKEQEAVKPKYKERMGGFVTGLCPTCGTALNNIHNVKACGKCGQAVKWDG